MVSSCAMLGPAVDPPPNTLVHVHRATLTITNVYLNQLVQLD